MRKKGLNFSFRVIALASVVMGTTCLLSSCTKKAGAPGAKRQVNLAIWSNYASPELLKDFETKTGITVQVSNYSSNEELLAKLQAGASGYDVAVPSDYMVLAMDHLGLLTELDHQKIANESKIDKRFLKKPYDPSNRVSLPYDWGTTGIAVNRDIYKGEIKGWKDLFTQESLKGKFTLLDDVRETLGAALKSQGLSLNSRNPSDLARAKAVLVGARARVKGYTSEPMMPLVNGETAVAHVYSSDALQARRETGGKIEYILPEEGGTLWVDNLVIPKGAPHLVEAHEFINFLLEATSAVQTTQSVRVGPVVDGVKALLTADLQRDNVLFPAATVLTRFEMMEDLGDALPAWDRAWTEVKAEN